MQLMEIRPHTPKHVVKHAHNHVPRWPAATKGGSNLRRNEKPDETTTTAVSMQLWKKNEKSGGATAGENGGHDGPLLEDYRRVATSL